VPPFWGGKADDIEELAAEATKLGSASHAVASAAESCSGAVGGHWLAGAAAALRQLTGVAVEDLLATIKSCHKAQAVASALAQQAVPTGDRSAERYAARTVEATRDFARLREAVLAKQKLLEANRMQACHCPLSKQNEHLHVRNGTHDLHTARTQNDCGAAECAAGGQGLGGSLPRRAEAFLGNRRHCCQPRHPRPCLWLDAD
jgi:hypothetical protein